MLDALLAKTSAWVNGLRPVSVSVNHSNDFHAHIVNPVENDVVRMHNQLAQVRSAVAVRCLA